MADHGELTGLSDDDHPQYLTETRHSSVGGPHVTNGDSHDHVGGDGAGITEAALTFSDVSTANVSDSAHGLCPKNPDDPTLYLSGEGYYTKPTRTGVKRTFWIPASAMTPDSSLNGPEPIGGVQYEMLDFPNYDQPCAYFSLRMPDEWNRGSLVAKVYWAAPPNGGSPGVCGVAWSICAISAGHNESLPEFGSGTHGHGIWEGEGKIHITGVLISLASTPDLGDFVVFRLRRETSDISDDLSQFAHLIGISIQYAESETEPSAW